MTQTNAKLRWTLLALLMTIMSVANTRGATVNAASCSQAHVQAAVNAAANGDTVLVPGGTCAWTSRVSWSNKNIHLRGAGIDQTVIEATGLFTIVAATNPASFRISGFTFTHGTGEASDAITIRNQDTSSFTKGWRIDHNRFLYSNAGETIMVYGLTWGLIDHNTWDYTAGGTCAAPLYIYGFLNSEYPPEGNNLHGAAYWSQPMNLGTDEAVYFEDNTVNCAGSRGQPFVYDMAYGGSIVMRYNRVQNAYIQTHSARSNARGGYKYEVYHNVFTDSNARFALKRSGSGVLFNNQVTGSMLTIDIDSQRMPGTCAFSGAPLGICSASNTYDGRIESSGWPCLDQPGRGRGVTGTNQQSVPLYAWNNGTLSTCATGGSCDNTTTIRLNCGDQAAYLKSTAHSNGQVDFVNNGSAPKPGYTPYTYPHPLVNATGGSDPPPTPTKPQILR